MEMRTVHLFVFDTLADWEAGFAIAGINNPAFQKRPGRYTVQTVSPGGGAVRTTGGVRIVADISLEGLDPSRSAMLILPGGAVWDEGGNAEAVEKARGFLAAGVPVAAICGATSGLARAGLLDDKRHTSNAPDYLKATGYRGEALYENEPAVVDGDLITAAGTAPLEFAYKIFEKLDVYDPETLEAWYALFKEGDASRYEALLAAAHPRG